MGWDRLSDGEFPDYAEQADFQVLLTSDKRIVNQQNLTGRKIALVVLGNSNWKVARRYVRRIATAVDASVPDSYIEIAIPSR